MDHFDSNFHAESLLKWLRTFQIGESDSLSCLSDGVTLAKVLHQIEPEWFSKTWITTINTNAAQNWRLKVSNLKKLVTKLMEYYQEYHGYQMSSFQPNINLIAEHGDNENLIKLLQLVLGCAVNCSNKQEYIMKMRDMDENEDVKRALMQIIQDFERGIQEHASLALSVGSEESLAEVTAHLRKVTDELRIVKEERDQMKQRCQELDSQAVMLQDEKTSLQGEINKLLEKLNDFDGEKPNKDFKKQIEFFKEELFKAETARDDYRAKVKHLEKEMMEMQARQLELQQASEEARTLKDELDILREAADKAANYEATIETYKKKLEEFSDLKRRYKLLEDKNIEYMRNTMELEEEIKKSVTLKPQVDMYKKQLNDLHQKLAEETKRADKNDFESRISQEKLQALTKEKERLMNERDHLKESVEELKFSQLQHLSTSSEVTPSNASTENTDPLHLQEKIVRLEHENKLLKQRNTGEEKVFLQTQIEDLTQRIELEKSDNRRANNKVLELENLVCEMQEQLTKGVGLTDSNSSYKQQYNLLQAKLEQISNEKEQKCSQLEEKETIIVELRQKVTSLQDVITRKESEIAAKEEKYKKCVDKAKSVIQSLEPSQQITPDIAELRNQIKEKERIIESLEKEVETKNIHRDMEEKLMITAFNRYSTQLHRQAVEQRLSHLSPSAGASYLSRQRQPTNRRVPAHSTSPSAYNARRLQQRNAQDFEDMKVN